MKTNYDLGNDIVMKINEYEYVLENIESLDKINSYNETQRKEKIANVKGNLHSLHWVLEQIL